MLDTARQLRGFGPVGVLAVLIILAGSLAGAIVASILVLVWADMSETPLAALGIVAPRSWTATLVGGAVFGLVFKLFLKAVVMPLLGAPALNMPYHYLAGNAGALPGAIAMVLISAAIGEEIFFRGYLFERLGALLGTGTAALAATILLTSALFAAGHYQNMGLPGVEQAAITGMVFGGIFAWRKQIVVVMVAHAAFDVAAIALIYANWEEPVAHLLFR